MNEFIFNTSVIILFCGQPIGRTSLFMGEDVITFMNCPVIENNCHEFVFCRFLSRCTIYIAIN